MTTNHPSIARNIADIRQKILSACRSANRHKEALTLIAVSKNHPITRIQEALDTGHRVFGENQVQEAQEKWTAPKALYPDLCLHFIGALQRNKVRQAVQLFDVIESVDRLSLAQKLGKAITETGRSIDCYIQVNTGEEAQKSGVLPQDFPAFLEQCRACDLNITGVMGIPPVQDGPEFHFALLSDIARNHHLPNVSMGMSRDFENAIRFGATHIRVGSAIFGNR